VQGHAPRHGRQHGGDGRRYDCDGEGPDDKDGMQSLSWMKTRVGALLAPAHDRVAPSRRMPRPARPPRTRRYESCLGCTFDGRGSRSVRQRHSSGEDTSGRHLHVGSWSANACASVNTWPQRTHSTVTARSVRAQRLSCRRRSARLAHLAVERGRAGDHVEAVCGRVHDPGHTSARGSFGGSSPGSRGNARREAASGGCLESFSWLLAHSPSAAAWAGQATAGRDGVPQWRSWAQMLHPLSR
jgi:hypothetical protein